MMRRVLIGRKAIDAYRVTHCQLHSKPRHRGVPEEHTPLLEAMVRRLEAQGFTFQGFFDANQAVVEAEYSKIYLRGGECNRCGKCCEGCKHYIEGQCVIYEGRPQRCKDYPTGQDYERGIPNECGYTFTRTEYQPEFDVEWR